METRANYVIVGIFTLIAIAGRVRLRLLDGGDRRPWRDRDAAHSHPGLGVGPRSRQRGAVQRRQGRRRRSASTSTCTNPTVAIADTAGRPADADHQVDAGRRRPCRPDRPGQHRAEGRRPARSPTCSTRPKQEGHDRRDHRQSVGRDQPPADGAGHLQARRQCAERAGELYAGRARAADRRRSRMRRNSREALANNSDGIDKFLTSVSALSEELAGVSGKLDGTLKAAEELLKSVDPRKIAERSSAMSRPSPASLKEQSDAVRRDRRRRRRRPVASINDFAKQARADAGQGRRRSGRRRSGRRSRTALANIAQGERQRRQGGGRHRRASPASSARARTTSTR